MKLAALPPLVNRPPQSAGYPSRSAIQRTAWSSISVAIGDDGHDTTLGLTAPASRSPSAPSGAAEPMM